MESEGTLSYSQVPATCPCPEPAQPVISLAQLMDWKWILKEFSTVNLVNIGFFLFEIFNLFRGPTGALLNVYRGLFQKG